SQAVTLPSVPALACGTTLIVAMLVSLPQGAAPVMVYSKVLTALVPGAGVKVPSVASKTPPLPVTLVQVPPVCSPVMMPLREIAAVLLSQTVAAVPSAPALDCG